MQQFIIFVVLLTLIGLSACSSSEEEFLEIVSFRFYAGDRMIEEVFFYSEAADSLVNIIEEVKQHPQDNIYLSRALLERCLDLTGATEAAQSLQNIEESLKKVDAVTMVTIKIAAPSQAMLKTSIKTIWQKPKSAPTFGDNKINQNDLKELQKIMKAKQ